MDVEEFLEHLSDLHLNLGIVLCESIDKVLRAFYFEVLLFTSISLVDLFKLSDFIIELERIREMGLDQLLELEMLVEVLIKIIFSYFIFELVNTHLMHAQIGWQDQLALGTLDIQLVNCCSE